MNVLTIAILANISALLALASCLLALRRQRQLLDLFGGHLELARVHSEIITDIAGRLEALEREPWK